MSTICKLDPTVRRRRYQRKNLRRLAHTIAATAPARVALDLRIIAQRLERIRGDHDRFMAVWTRHFGAESAARV